jgi:hypothetical protein
MRLLRGLLASVLLLSCAPSVPATLPDPNADVGLGDVQLLVWTTRSESGLLGHALSPGTSAIDPNRKVVEGAQHLTPTDQHLIVVSAQTLDVGAAAGAAGVALSANVNRATHVAYDVRISGYLELFPEDARYVPGSSCCQAGVVSATCGERYVTRLIRGSGSVEHLQKLEATAGVEASELVRAHGGTTYRKLNKTSFVDAFFAYQLEPLATLCARLSPEQEMETLSVNAPNNCWVQAHLEDGSRQARAWHVPDAALCRKLAEHHCGTLEHVAACTASFGSDGQAAPLSLFTPAPAPQVEPAPTPSAPVIAPAP